MGDRKGYYGNLYWTFVLEKNYIKHRNLASCFCTNSWLPALTARGSAVGKKGDSLKAGTAEVGLLCRNTRSTFPHSEKTVRKAA